MQWACTRISLGTSPRIRMGVHGPGVPLPRASAGNPYEQTPRAGKSLCPRAERKNDDRSPCFSQNTDSGGLGCLILGFEGPEVSASSPEDESDDEGMARVSPCQKAKPVKACAFPGGLGDWYLWVVLCQKRHLFGLPVNPVAEIDRPRFPGYPFSFDQGYGGEEAKDRAPDKHLAMSAGALGEAAGGGGLITSSKGISSHSFALAIDRSMTRGKTPFSIHQILAEKRAIDRRPSKHLAMSAGRGGRGAATREAKPRIPSRIRGHSRANPLTEKNQFHLAMVVPPRKRARHPWMGK